MNATPGGKVKKNLLKMAVIPLLLGVLGIVVWRNQGPESNDVALAAPAAIATSAPMSPNVENTTDAGVKKHKRVPWPKFTSEQILATNPFRGSAAMRAALKPAPEVVTQQAQPTSEGASAAEGELSYAVDTWSGLVATFKEDSIGVYIDSSKGPALKIGSRLLHVGDRIGERYRITAIRQDGIVVEAAAPALK